MRISLRKQVLPFFFVFALGHFTFILVVSSIFFYHVHQAKKQFVQGQYDASFQLIQPLLFETKMLDIGTIGVFHSSLISPIRKSLFLLEMMKETKNSFTAYFTAALQGNENQSAMFFQEGTRQYHKLEQMYLDWRNLEQTSAFVRFFLHKTGLDERILIIDKSLPVIADLFFLLDSINQPSEKRFIVLLQNNYELRPTGGFLGSFALVTTKNGAVISLEVQDIYVPDGQLEGYVVPPKPIETYLFQQGGWKLRDANWDPNFPTSAETIAWFFTRGGYKNNDGIIAINLSVLQRMLSITGSIYLSDYNQEITAENLYSIVQAESEQDFFPGATQKKDILGSLTRAFFRKLENIDLKLLQEIAKELMRDVVTKDIMAWSPDPQFQEKFIQFHADGSLLHPSCAKTNCVFDTLALIEANVGINKTNCCIDRTVEYDLWIEKDGSIHSTVVLQYRNNNPITPDPPRHYGGGYENYLRVYRNAENILESAYQDDPVTSLSTPLFFQSSFREDLSLLEYGQLVEIGGQEEKTVTLLFQEKKTLDLSRQANYTLLIQKQSGLLTNQYRIRIHYPNTVTIKSEQDFGEVNTAQGFLQFDSIVDRNKEYSFTFKPL